MKKQCDKQEITQLLNKFMAGETSLAEEQVLAQYFRTHEVDEEWTEYKEMFALFDNGEVDIEGCFPRRSGRSPRLLLSSGSLLLPPHACSCF